MKPSPLSCPQQPVTCNIHKDEHFAFWSLVTKKWICQHEALPRELLSLSPGRKCTHAAALHLSCFSLSSLSVGVRMLWGRKGALRGPSIKLSAALRIPPPHTDNPPLHKNKGANNPSVAAHSMNKHSQCMQLLENINKCVWVSFMKCTFFSII